MTFPRVPFGCIVMHIGQTSEKTSRTKQPEILHGVQKRGRRNLIQLFRIFISTKLFFVIIFHFYFLSQWKNVSTRIRDMCGDTFECYEKKRDELDDKIIILLVIFSFVFTLYFLIKKALCFFFSLLSSWTQHQWRVIRIFLDAFQVPILLSSYIFPRFFSLDYSFIINL